MVCFLPSIFTMLGMENGASPIHVVDKCSTKIFYDQKVGVRASMTTLGTGKPTNDS